MKIIDRWVEHKQIKSAADFLRWYDRFSRSKTTWIFRGQRNSRWGLETSMERCRKHTSYRGMARVRLEKGLIRDFQRRYTQYASAPDLDDTLQWLAIMQHHGAPTRLLDWTYSYFVAAYFAVESEMDKEGSAIWALDVGWCRKIANHWMKEPDIEKDLLRQRGDTKSKQRFRNYLGWDRREGLRVIYPVNPFTFNERLTIQQGIFLCPADVTCTFAENVVAMTKLISYQGRFLKLLVPRKIRKQVLQHLHRMNMDAATLFPGLDGFSRSLHTKPLFAEWLVQDYE